MPNDMDVVASALRAVGSAALNLTRILRGQTRFGRWSSTADINVPLNAFAHFPVYLGAIANPSILTTLSALNSKSNSNL